MRDSSLPNVLSKSELAYPAARMPVLLKAVEGALLLLGGWAYWPTLQNIFEAWISNPDYSHGFLVLPIAFSFLWARRDSRPVAQSAVCWLGLVLLVIAGLLRFAAGRLYLPELDGWSIPLWMGGVVLLFHGWGFFRWALPSLLFLWFATPMPGSFEILLSTPLQQLAAEWGSWTLRLAGQPAIAEGTTILLNEHVLDIERACSGLRMFYGIFALAVACVVLARLRGWTALTVLFAAVPVALLANVFRIVVTGILLQSVSGEAAQKFSHDFAGLMMIPLAVLMFGLLLWWLQGVRSRFRSAQAEGVSWLLQWGVCALLLMCTLLWWGNQQRRHAFHALLDLASRHESKQDWQQASVYLQRYLQANPKDQDALDRFAIVFSKTATRRRDKLRSIALLHNAWRKQSSRHDLALSAAQTAFEIGEYRKSVQVCEELLAAPKLQNRTEITLLHADALLLHLDGAPTLKYSWEDLAGVLEATRSLETQLTGQRLYYEIELAKIWQEDLVKPNQKTRAKYAREIMDGMVAKHPENPLALLARHKFLTKYSLNNPSDQQLAEQDLRQALKIAEQADASGKTALYLAAAAHHQLADDLPAVEMFLRLAIAETPADHRPYVALAEMKRSTGEATDRQEAIDLLEAGLGVVTEHELALRLPLASLYVEAQKWEVAEKSIEAVEALVPTLPHRRQIRLKLGIGLVRSQILWKREGVYPAIRVLQPVVNDEDVRLYRQEFPRLLAQTHVLLGKLYSSVDIHDRASEQYRFALQLDPEAKPTRIAAADSALRAGDLESAELLCRTLLKDDSRSDQALLAMIRIQVRRQLRLVPDSRDWTAAEQALEKAQQRNVSSAKLLPAELELLLAKGDFAQAEDYLLQAIEQAPEEPLLWRELTALLDHRGQKERALEAANKYLQLAPTEIRPYVLKATLLEKSNRGQEAQDLLDNFLQRCTEKRWVVAAQQLARLQLLLGNIDKAKMLLEKAHQKEPSDLTVLSTLASLAWVATDWETLERYESWLQEVEGKAGTLWRFYHAQRLLVEAVSTEDPKFTEVQRLSQTIQKLRPRWSKTSLLIGDLALRSGQVDAAIAAFQQAWSLGDRSALLADRLIDLLTRQARFDEAQGYVSQVRSALPLSSRLFDRAIPYYVRSGEQNGALKLAEAWVARQPNDAAAQLRLGRVLLILSTGVEQNAVRYLQRAESAFLQALKLAPTDASVWVANVMFAKQKEEEEEPLAQILDKLNRHVEMAEYARALVLAELNQILSRPLVAQEHYRRAIDLAAHEEAAAEVKALGSAAQFYLGRVPYLAEHYARRALAIAPEAILARQVLLQVLMDSNKMGGVEEALAILDSRPRSDLSGWEADQERRMRAKLILRQHQPGKLAEAIRLLETLLAKRPEDKQLLAALYESSGRIGPAFDLLSELSSAKAARPEDQTAFLEFWQRHFLVQTEQHQRAKFATLAGQAYQRLRQSPAQQDEWLRWKLRESKKQKITWQKVQSLVADLLEANQNLVHWSDEAKLVWCRSLLLVLIEENSINSAIQFIAHPPTEIHNADAAIALCHAMILSSVASEFWPEVNVCLRDAQVGSPQRSDLARAIGDYQFMTGQYGLAVGAYRSALAVNPQDHSARNNLALTLGELPGRLAEARQVLDTAIEKNVTDPVLLDTMAVLELIDRRAGEALKLLEQVLAVSPENAQAKIHVAMGYQALGDEISMREALLDAIGLGVNVSLLSLRDREFFVEMSKQVMTKQFFITPSEKVSTVSGEPSVRLENSKFLSY